MKMQAKPHRGNSVEQLYLSAKDIVQVYRKTLREHGFDGSEVRIPVLVSGTDMRIMIMAGPSIAARNVTEGARMNASGEPLGGPQEALQTLSEAKALLLGYAAHLRASLQGSGILGEGVSEKDILTLAAKAEAFSRRLDEVKDFV